MKYRCYGRVCIRVHLVTALSTKGASRAWFNQGNKLKKAVTQVRHRAMIQVRVRAMMQVRHRAVMQVRHRAMMQVRLRAVVQVVVFVAVVRGTVRAWHRVVTQVRHRAVEETSLLHNSFGLGFLSRPVGHLQGVLLGYGRARWAGHIRVRTGFDHRSPFMYLPDLLSGS